MTSNDIEHGALRKPAPLNLLAHLLADVLVREVGDKVQVVRDDARQLLAVEEAIGGIAFAEAEGDELRITPYGHGAEAVEQPPFAVRVGPSMVDGVDEIVVRLSALGDTAYQAEVIGLLRSALEHWTEASRPVPVTDESDAAPVQPPTVSVEDLKLDPDAEPEAPPEDVEPTVAAQIKADISEQWSWASSAARIPQIAGLQVSVIEPVENVRITVSVQDADITFGSSLVFEGHLKAGTTEIGSVHVPLSASVMSRVMDRHGAECSIEVRDTATDKVLGRMSEAVDIQPRDLWLWRGDPRRERAISSLAQTLLASFVRPNHPEVAVIAREAADLLGEATGDPSFAAFQLPDIEDAAQRADKTVEAIYNALKARRIAYSEPPPGWDYTTEGQRIRDHGDVAGGGLGTCMDTTVLAAAVIEHVGLLPVLVLIPEHIFVGYWRRDPQVGLTSKPEWYPGLPSFDDPAVVESLIEGGFLGVVETTVFTVGKDIDAAEAREIARRQNVPAGRGGGRLEVIDVAAARRSGVSPLPAINHRPDGVTEVIEYRSGGADAVIEVPSEPLDAASQKRHVDTHPARYRTWKASLFSLNATNDLLNLKNNAKVQPLVVPPTALGALEDRLNQDVTFSLRSGYDIPVVWRAREIPNALALLESGKADDQQELVQQLSDRNLFVQRIGRSKGQLTALAPPTFVREVRSMAHAAKTVKEERGMNPLYLCLGLLRWPHKPGDFAEAPLILVPVNISVTRGRQDFTLSLDASQQTTPNAALIEWLRREHGLTISGLVEPLTDRAGIDVDGVLSEVRRAVADAGLPFDVRAEARLAVLDLAAFRMWQDLNQHADSFMSRPLVRHLVETPTETFIDPVAAGGESDTTFEDELESLETPIPADSTQKRAVLWARQGRTFVLQGPPGTGKSQTITNMVAECVLAGLKVLFVAEKGTALAVVQRRLDAIGLGPFTLNLHHEGSNAAEVRAQLRKSMTAAGSPDAAAMENARRRLRSARFELTKYPQQLHEPNAAGLSAYSAHDELLVVGDGATMPVSPTAVAHHSEQIAALRELFQDLQTWTTAAAVRPGHPWRFAGVGAGEPLDVEAVSAAIRDVTTGLSWAVTMTGELRDALAAVTHPSQFDSLAAMTNPALPAGTELAGVLQPTWVAAAKDMVDGCERSVEGWRPKLHGFDPMVLTLDLRSVALQIKAANESGFVGRKNRQAAAIESLVRVAPVGLELTADTAPAIVADLIAVQDTAGQVRAALASVAGLGSVVPLNPFQFGALAPVRARLDELEIATAGLRGATEWVQRVQSLGESGILDAHAKQLRTLDTAWRTLWDGLAVQDADFEAWRAGRTLEEAVHQHQADWHREVDFERLVPLQRWCTLVRKLEPLRAIGLDEARVQLLEGTLPAYAAEEALLRGVARASLDERIDAAGLNRFDAVAHDLRVESYSEAQSEIRQQWITTGPAQLLVRRAESIGTGIGGLDRELQKSSRKLGTRPILRKYGDAVQALTPLVLCSPSSAVDLIEPGVMEFDLVIFDEASQITVPEAVGALGRAKAAVVVGDSKQMPPTRRIGGGPADDEEFDDLEVEEIVEDQESILTECELARVPTLSLNWHYRSQDEELIAFSNRAYYRGELSSFPTPTLSSTETGVEFRRIEGQYLRAGSKPVELAGGVIAGNNTNPIEAEAIVAYVHELANKGSKLPSIGIATFNEQQRQLIEDLLHKSADPKVADVMDETKMGSGEALFVKALEQVQGDERDIIIFSVAFSKQANGKIPTNFGPLSNSGGERRLNVAITRARRKNVVFCSFEPGELDVSASTFEGPKHLKEFLTFARNAGRFDDAGGAVQRATTRDRHRDDIAAALRDAGLHVRTDVGLSNFRLDLLLSRSDEPDRPLLPVLLDGEGWRQRSTVSDRDVLPVEVLEGLMGWPKIARVWWPMWLQNRDEVIRQVLAEVEEAERALNHELSGVTHAPPVPVGKGTAPAVDEPAPATTVPSVLPGPSAPSAPAAGTQSSAEAEIHPAATLPSGRATTDDAASGSSGRETPAAAEGAGLADADLPGLLAPPSPSTAETLSTPDLGVPAVEPAPVVSQADSAAAAHAASDVSASQTEQPVAEQVAAESSVAHPAVQTPPADPDAITVFKPASSAVVGARSVLDALPDREAASTVREQLLDVIESEGPVELGRLTRIVARRFGLNAVRSSRADAIAALVPRRQLRKSRLGAFAWPAPLDPETWRGYRTFDPDSSRTLDEVAPEEIANAMRAARAKAPNAGDEHVLRSAAEAFGIARLGTNVRSRLERVLKKLPLDEDASASESSPGTDAPPSVTEVSDRPNAFDGETVLVQPGDPGSSSPSRPTADPVIEEPARQDDDVKATNVVAELKYYDYSTDRQVACSQCEWSGRAGDAQSVHDDRLEVRCALCGDLILVAMFPNIEEARDAAAAGNPQAISDLPGFEEQQAQRKEAFDRVDSFWKRPTIVDYYDYNQAVVPTAAQALAELRESEQGEALEVIARTVIAHLEKLDLDDQGVVDLAASVVDDFYKTVATTLTWPPEASRYVQATFAVIMDWVARRGFTLRYIVDSTWPDGLDRPIVNFPQLMAFANLGYICPHQLAWKMAQSDGALPDDRTPTLEQLSRWIAEGRHVANKAVERFSDANHHIVFMEADWVEGCLDGVMGSTRPGTIEIFRSEAPTAGSKINVKVIPRSAS